MPKETSLENVKDVAKIFLDLDIVETSSSPIVIQHPYFSIGIIAVKSEDTEEYKIVNILEDAEAFNQQKDKIEKQINAVEDIEHLEIMITKPYKLGFLKYIEAYLSPADLGRYIASAWSQVEYITTDKDVSSTELISYFRQSDKQTLMSDEEREFLKALPDEIEVFRGVTDFNKESVKEAVSWTTDIKTARFFASRFGKCGYVYKASIRKQYVLAYFSGRHESEVVVNPNKLQSIERVETIKRDNIEAV